MSTHEEDIQLTVSVGGTKCEFAAVRIQSNGFIARSGRIEWACQSVSSFEEFVAMVARQLKSLLKDNSIRPERVVHVGVAWPGPQIGDCCLATFIPGGSTPRPFAATLKAEMAAVIDERFRTVPVTVWLDAIARAAGESLPGGSLFRGQHNPAKAGMLVNLATGIAGAMVHGTPLLSVPGIGQNYGQFGRFLFFNTIEQNWDWRPSTDGSVVAHRRGEVRWTQLSAGPALANRFGLWAAETGVEGAGAPAAVRKALVHYATPDAPRNLMLEKAILSWITAEANRVPKGRVVEFVRQSGSEIGGALRLLFDVFSAYPIDRIVLAGGVGENFGRTDCADGGAFLDAVRENFGRMDCVVTRASLGVEAELLGFPPPGNGT